MRCFLFWTLTVLTAVNVFAKTPDADELHRRVKRSGGEVIIQRIPSVSAKRNYCVPASVDMVLRYYDTRVGQRTLGKLFDSSKKNGTYSRNIVKEFGKGELSGFRCEIVYGMLQQELERLIELYTNSPELKRSVRKKFKKQLSKSDTFFDPMDPGIVRKFTPQARKELLAVFPKILKTFIDRGCPLLWCVIMNFDPHDRTDGGHMRVIAGYEEKDGKITRIIYLDPWSNKRKFKEMKYMDAVTETTLILAVIPDSIANQ